MQPADRLRLTAALREHVAAIAVDLRATMRAPGPARERALALHREEGVGDAFEVWTDLLSRRAAVLWVLKSVYVRVLEDRRLLHPGRLLDPGAQHLFERLAPHLGDTAFLAWIHRDLASRRGGLPELFAPQPAEVARPSDERSKALVDFWRHEDPDTGACWSFADERFEGELMGDLYQELDPVVKDRFALCQTPDFVRAFIMERTLTPAIGTFGADGVRMIDPACGSGHFLIDGLKRLVAATGAQHPEWSRLALVKHALDRVVGIDLNDYACALARARLIMTAAELAGVTTLAEAAQFHPHVYWADGLEQVEREACRVEVEQPELFGEAPAAPAAVRASLTRPEVKGVLRGVLAPGFHAVVANPPYIVERDEARKAYHREETGGRRRYVSACKQYSLVSPFVERTLQLALREGFIGLIVGNNFMKREFGKPLVESVLASVDLNLVVDTSQAFIPGHGTPTVLLFARNRRAQDGPVRAVMGKRGEPSIPAVPSEGRVWSSVVEGWDRVGFENDFVSVSDVPRPTFARHPWSLGGGGAAELKQHLEKIAEMTLVETQADIGFVCMTRADDVYFAPREALRRAGIADRYIVDNIQGDVVRDWAIVEPCACLFPYEADLSPADPTDGRAVLEWLWPYREQLWLRREHQGNHRQLGMTWYEWSRFIRYRFRTPLSLAFSFVATHNHFVLDRGGKVFNRSAPVIKLPADATEDDHLALLGLLNSSTACFWMKQVFHDKGGGTDTGKWQSDRAKVAYEFAGTGMLKFPVPAMPPGPREALVGLSRHLDALARERADALARALPEIDRMPASLPHGIPEPSVPVSAAGLREAIARAEAREAAILRRQIALQEEADWQVYGLYGLLQDPHPLDPDRLASSTGAPIGSRPFELLQARGGRALGVDGHALMTGIPDDVDPWIREAWEHRAGLLAASPELTLIEHESYKRRWSITPKHLAGRVETFQDRLGIRLRRLLGDLVEEAARRRTRAFTATRLASDLQADPRFLALAEVWVGRRDFDPGTLVRTCLREESVPCHPLHRYTASGLVKRAAWEQTWADQRREDAGEKVTPAVPPAYNAADFLDARVFDLRGKLDVPKERFIAFTEAPPQGDPSGERRSGAAGPFADDTLFGWAGWTPVQRVKALLGIDEDLDDRGVPVADRVGLLDSAWRLLPDAEREDPASANRLKAELQSIIGIEGPSRERVDAWRHRFPPPGTRPARARRSRS